MMSANITDVEPDEVETCPMTDLEHAEVFGWAWDDPNAVGELS